MGLITVASIILLYRFSLQAAKPYIPLQRGRTNWSLFPNNTQNPLQHNMSSNLLSGKSNESYPVQNKFRYGAVNSPVEMLVLKSSRASDNSLKGIHQGNIPSMSTTTVVPKMDELTTVANPKSDTELDRSSNHGNLSQSTIPNIERISSHAPIKIPEVFQSTKDALSQLGNSLISVISKSKSSSREDLEILISKEELEHAETEKVDCTPVTAI